MASITGGRVLPGRLPRLWDHAEALAGTAGAVLLVLLTRLPLRTRYLLNWDAAQFALGLQRFDVVHHQPHPPGYPGYELVGRLLLAVFGDANTALVALSIAGEAIAAALMFWFARTLFGRTAGWISALGLVVSPLYWYYGEAADTYALEPPLVIAAAWLCWRAWNGSRRDAILASILLGLGGSLRPSTAVLLSPLLAVCLLRLGSRRTSAMALGAGLSLVSVWAIPLVVLAGGPAAYLKAAIELGGSVTSGTAIWRTGLGGLQTTGPAVILGTVWELGVLLIPLAFGLAVAPRLASIPRMLPSGWAAFSWIWVLPALATFLLVHIGQVVYVQVFVPALFLVAGPALSSTCAALRRPNLLAPLATGCLFLNLLLFFLPTSNSLAAQLADHDRRVASLVATVATYDPDRTALVLDAYASGNYRLAQVYLPAYQRVAVARDERGQVGEIFGDVYAPERFQRASRLQFRPATDTFIFPDSQVVGDLVANPSRFETRRLPAGEVVRVWRGAPPALYGGLIWLGSPFTGRAAPEP